MIFWNYGWAAVFIYFWSIWSLKVHTNQINSENFNDDDFNIYKGHHWSIWRILMPLRSFEIRVPHPLKRSVHFDRFALFQFIFSWWETFCHFEIFESKLCQRNVATFELTFFNLFYFQIDYFYFINRLLKKHSKNVRLLSKVS